MIIKSDKKEVKKREYISRWGRDFTDLISKIIPLLLLACAALLIFGGLISMAVVIANTLFGKLIIGIIICVIGWVMMDVFLDYLLTPVMVGVTILGIASTINIYDETPGQVPLEVVKYEFVDVTEKLVITLREPEGKLIVINLDDDYYRLRSQNGNPLTLTLEMNSSTDFLDRYILDDGASLYWHRILVEIGTEKLNHRICADYSTKMCSRSDSKITMV